DEKPTGPCGRVGGGAEGRAQRGGSVLEDVDAAQHGPGDKLGVGSAEAPGVAVGGRAQTLARCRRATGEAPQLGHTDDRRDPADGLPADLEPRGRRSTAAGRSAGHAEGLGTGSEPRWALTGVPFRHGDPSAPGAAAQTGQGCDHEPGGATPPTPSSGHRRSTGPVTGSRTVTGLVTVSFPATSRTATNIVTTVPSGKGPRVPSKPVGAVKLPSA